jgi:hypothetical protein
MFLTGREDIPRKFSHQEIRNICSREGYQKVNYIIFNVRIVRIKDRPTLSAGMAWPGGGGFRSFCQGAGTPVVLISVRHIMPLTASQTAAPNSAGFLKVKTI